MSTVLGDLIGYVVTQPHIHHQKLGFSVVELKAVVGRHPDVMTEVDRNLQPQRCETIQMERRDGQ